EDLVVEHADDVRVASLGQAAGNVDFLLEAEPNRLVAHQRRGGHLDGDLPLRPTSESMRYLRPTRNPRGRLRQTGMPPARPEIVESWASVPATCGAA